MESSSGPFYTLFLNSSDIIGFLFPFLLSVSRLPPPQKKEWVLMWGDEMGSDGSPWRMKSPGWISVCQFWYIIECMACKLPHILAVQRNSGYLWHLGSLTLFRHVFLFSKYMHLNIHCLSFPLCQQQRRRVPPQTLPVRTDSACPLGGAVTGNQSVSMARMRRTPPAVSSHALTQHCTYTDGLYIERRTITYTSNHRHYTLTMGSVYFLFSHFHLVWKLSSR